MGSIAEKANKTVCIIGTGPAGLVSAKEALENGLNPTVLEKDSDLGGVWNPHTGFVWKSLKTNLSKFTTSFGGTDWTKTENANLDMFPSNQHMFKYLNDYADKWNLRPFIKFQCEVIKVTHVGPSGANGWVVIWKKSDQSTESQVFDGVIVATGINREPYFPNDIKGLDTFTGKLIHSRDYKDPLDFEAKRVLVVGGSISGAEISVDVSSQASQTIHCFRRPLFVLKRFVTDKSRNNAKLPIDMVFFQNRNSALRQKMNPPTSKEEARKLGNQAMMTLCEEQLEFEVFRISPEEMTQSINFVISDEYLNQIRKEKIQPIKQPIREIQGSKVIFNNGEIHEVDCIVLATGFYSTNMSIFDQNVLDTLGYDPMDQHLPFILFKATLHPDYSNLFFIGQFKGALFYIMEQQARWVCKILAEKVTLPSKEILIEGVKKEINFRGRKPRPHPEIADWTDDLATLGDSFPDLDKLQNNEFSLASSFGKPLPVKDIDLFESKKSEIYNMLLTQPVIPAHYDLVNCPEETLKQMNYLEKHVLN